MVRRTSKPKPKGILGRAKAISEAEKIISALFYGRSGTGKTTVSGSFPKPMLVVDVGERGGDSISDEEGIDIISIDTWEDFEELYWELKSGNHKYKSVSIDALHSLQSLAIAKVKADNKKSEDDQTSQRDFGQAGGLMVTWLFNYRDLIQDGIRVVMLAHDRVSEVEAEEDDAIAPEVGPRLMPSVASAVCGMVNIVGSTFVRQVTEKPKVVGGKKKVTTEYCMRIGPNGYYVTKIRKPKKIPLPEFIVDPTYDKLMDVVNGKSEKPTTSKRKLTRRK